MPPLIAICGNVGSGKTTLACNLAQALNWQFVSVEERSSLYLNDLLRQPSRWSFEAQMSYLTRKAEGILSATGRTPILLDRALEEDVDIFAAYWAASGSMDPRAFGLFQDMAQLIADILPTPDAYLLCDAPGDLSESRVAERSRLESRPAPSLDIHRLAQMYRRWWEELECPRKLRLDAERTDFRDPGNVARIASLLSDWGLEDEGQLELVPKTVPPRAPEGRPPSLALDGRAPQIYLAGPFSAVTVEEDEGPQDRLFAAPRMVISRDSDWRTVFEKTARSLGQRGWGVFLPHRDVSRWGGRTLTPQRVADECLAAVRASEAVLAIPGLSFGTHVEAGVALGRRIPTVVVRPRDLETSFFAGGLAASPAVGEIAIERFSDLPDAVSSPEFDRALERAFAGARSHS